MALTFFWRCESATFSGTDDHSAGDSTPTATGTPDYTTPSFVGTNSLYSIGTEYVTFDSASIYLEAAGSAAFSFYIADWNTDVELLGFHDASVANNHIKVSVSGTGVADGEIGLYIRKSGSVNTSIVTTSANLSTSTWYSCVIRWSDTADDVKIEVYNAAGTLLDSAENLSVGDAFSGLIDEFRVGNVSASGSFNVNIDNVMVANDYNEPLEDNLDITSYTLYGGAVAAIDTVDSPVLDAETGNALTTSNFGSAINSITLETSAGVNEVDASASIGGSAGSWTFDMPSVYNTAVNVAGTPMDSASWAHTITAEDGTDSDTEVIVINPASGWARIELASPVKTAGSVLENFIGTPVSTDQVLYPTANATSVSATGILTTDQTTGTIDMVFWDSAGEHVIDGAFTDAANWTLGTGWSVGSGVASSASGTSSDLYQTPELDFVVGGTYEFIYTISGYVSGSATIGLAGGTAVSGTARTANGTYTESLVAATGNTIQRITSSVTGAFNIDTFSVKRTDAPSGIWKPFTLTLSVVTTTSDGVLRSVLRSVLLDTTRTVH